MRITNKIFGILLSLVTAAVFCLSNAACQPEGIVDNSEFSLYYPGITDVGPSTPMSLTPTFIGQTPSDFVITKVTVDGELIESECFTVNAKSGVFSMSNTDNLAVGLYKISISCLSSGKTWYFDDIITINMMKVIPDGISVEPAEIKLPLTDITEPASGTVLPTAQIITEGEHISIKSYKIAAARRNGVVVTDFDKLFSVSADGLVSIKANNRDFLPVVYVLDFKLVTFVVDEDSQEGIFPNALTINITSAPKSLVYTPSEGKIEEGIGWTFEAPAVAGSVEGLKFSFDRLRRMDADGNSHDFTDAEKAWLNIDASTGAITVKEGHGFAAGDVLTIAVTVENSYGKMTASRALVLSVVKAIRPIKNFTYADVNIVQIQKFTQNLPADFSGDDVAFSFVNLDAKLTEYLTLDAATGEIKAPRNHEIPVGTYTITVHAENQKGGIDTSFKLIVAENPNYFTYFHYGNNLGLGATKEEVVSYPAQYRLDMDNPQTIKIAVYASDIKPGTSVKFTMKAVDSEAASPFWWDRASQQKIDAATGEITYNPKTVRRQVQVARITAKAGEGETSVTRETLLFIHLATTVHGHKVEFTPFVMRFNPKSGKGLDKPTLNVNGKPADQSTFTIDYRGDIRYANIGGPDSHVDGRPGDAGDTFMKQLYQKYFKSINVALNTGGRDPVSYFQRPNNLNSNLLYVDNKDDYQMKVNPNIWSNDDGWANGLFISQMVFGDANGGDPNTNYGGGSSRIYQCAVWFDEKF